MEPLASTLRPETLNEVIGQDHLIGPGAPIRVAMEKRHLFSFILWGPPGVGKTTIARLYAKALSAEYFELSAVSAGKADVAKIIAHDTGKHPKVLFLDEIHRFNKAQQDFLLPHVENGTLTLIGATTENPSFEVIAPLLSRMKVFTLHELSLDHLYAIAIRTRIVDGEVARAVAELGNGDARRMIGILEETHRLYEEVNMETLRKTLHDQRLRYDKLGEEHYNTISAFIKSMRASQPDAALYYLARMIESGEDPLFIARRMVIFASEDVGLAQPTALVVANDVFRAVETIGLPEAGINLAHGVVYLAECKKDRRAYQAYMEAMGDAKKHGNLPVPLMIRNAPTKLMKELGYGKGYEQYTNEDLMPEKLKGKKYLKKKDHKAD